MAVYFLETTYEWALYMGIIINVMAIKYALHILINGIIRTINFLFC